jgi:serine/threonine-protein kinase
MAHVGRLVAGRYRIDALIGAGGMATVYRSLDTRLGREVAVKVLLPNLAADETIARRFGHEARSLAAVNHPAIVSVFDVGVDEDEPFFVMELVEGESLGDLIAREGPLSPALAVPMLLRVADGLSALHAAGFVHRDVKPENILLGPSGAKLADFGLARSGRSTAMTAPGTTVGTLGYLAPELLRGGPATEASDVYALGAVAYLALTDQLPHPPATLAGLVESHGRRPVLPSALGPWLGDAFDGPIMACLARDPAERLDLAGLRDGLASGLRAWRAAGRQEPYASIPTATETGDVDDAIDRAPIPTPAPVSADRPAPGAPRPALGASGGTGVIAGAPPQRRQAPAARPSFALRRTIAVSRTPARQRAGRSGGPWTAALAILMAIALVAILAAGFAVIAALNPASPPPATGGASPSPSAPASPSESPSLPPTPSPTAAPTPTPTPEPTATPIPTQNTESWTAAFEAVNSYLGAADTAAALGLSTGDARHLRNLADDVTRSLTRHNGPQAISGANDLLVATRQAEEQLDSHTAQNLDAAAMAVVNACQTLPGP